MKKIIITFVALIMVATVGKSQNRAASALKDPKQQEAILDSIANNSVLLQKVNDKAKAKGTMSSMNNMNMQGMNMGSDTSMMGMMNNTSMMNGMMDMMMAQCAKDSSMCRSMCNKMMNNPKMMDMMHGMMNNKGNMKMNH
jgi:hypothetical protein